jgi:hypothetical protein
MSMRFDESATPSMASAMVRSMRGAAFTAAPARANRVARPMLSLPLVSPARIVQGRYFRLENQQVGCNHPPLVRPGKAFRV